MVEIFKEISQILQQATALRIKQESKLSRPTAQFEKTSQSQFAYFGDGVMGKKHKNKTKQ